MIRNPTTSQSLKPTLFIFLQAILIAVFLVVSITTAPTIDGLYYHPLIGPISLQAELDGTNQLQVSWGEIISLPNGSTRCVIKCQAPTHNIDPILISEPFRVNWEPYGTWLYSENIHTTLTCDSTGNIAIGWIQPLPTWYLNPEDGQGYLRVYNNTAWSAIQSLPNTTVVSKFQLQYGLNGTLYAFYLNHLSDYQWQLQYWQVGSELPPTTLLNETSEGAHYLQRSQLLAGFDDHLYFFWDNYSQGDFGLAFRSYRNGSWTQDELVNADAYDLDDWLVVMSPDETIHVIWSEYSSDVHYRSYHNQTWSVTTDVIQIWGRLFDLEVDSDNNLQLLGQEYYIPPPGPFIGELFSPFYTMMRFGDSWDSPILLNDIPTQNSYVDLVMVDSQYSYLVHLQKFQSASQLVYYTVDVSTVYLNHNLYVSTVSEMLLRYRLLLIAKGAIIIFGALVFLPIVFVFSRYSFRRVLS
ncbi:MAG: hypothetical protein ACFFDJ_02560 [Candidatus Odinarchaeota archaeon]